MTKKIREIHVVVVDVLHARNTLISTCGRSSSANFKTSESTVSESKSALDISVLSYNGLFAFSFDPALLLRFTHTSLSDPDESDTLR